MCSSSGIWRRKERFRAEDGSREAFSSNEIFRLPSWSEHAALCMISSSSSFLLGLEVDTLSLPLLLRAFAEELGWEKPLNRMP